MNFQEHFELEFMRRTLKVVKRYRGAYDASLLLNCLLGLLIVPKERYLLDIPEDPIEDLAKWGVSPKAIIKRGEKRGKNKEGIEHDPNTLRGLVWDLRNSVAHSQFEPFPDGDIVGGFIFETESGLKAKIDLKEMRIFVEKLLICLEEAMD